ncbi:MAG: hypothetical protein JJT75_09345 [Opitutales bacterium]|nr:hypothetical protein [Opitutales bacterium]
MKGIQTGGPSGGIIPENKLETPVTFENRMELGSIMGFGGMLVMDERDCMVDVAAFYLKFCVDESCGKCGRCVQVCQEVQNVWALSFLDRGTNTRMAPPAILPSPNPPPSAAANAPSIA